MVGAVGSSVEGGEVRGGGVADIEHVARLLAVSVDGHGLAGDHPAGEDRDHAALLALEVLARAVDVRVTQHRVLEPESALEGAEVLLEAELAGAVRRQRPHRMVLVARHNVRLAVERAAGGDEDELAHAVVDRGFQQVYPSYEVHLRVKRRVGDRLRHLGLRGVVVDDLGLEGRHDRSDLGRIAQIESVHLRVTIEVVLVPGGEVVDYGDLVPGREVSIDDVRSDETCASGDENLHRP